MPGVGRHAVAFRGIDHLPSRALEHDDDGGHVAAAAVATDRNLQLVLASDRKKMSNDRAASRAVRQRIDADRLLRLG